MSKVDYQLQQLNFTYILLSGSGYLFILVAVIYSETLLKRLRLGPHEVAMDGQIGTIRLDFLMIGLALVLMAFLIRTLSNRLTWLQKPLTTNILLSILTVVVPIILLELGLKPFARTEATTIFMRDDELGWRLRPNAIGTWGGVPVKINAKGLRGPEVAYPKPANTFRILYLGDSVTFGFLLLHDEETFPYQIENVLRTRLIPTGGKQVQKPMQIETINAGVGGYSPWQYYRYLAREGLNYQPDLIVVGFVLNDVTEKFDLFRFGGHWEGYQLGHTTFSNFDRWASRSSILYMAKYLGSQLRFSLEGAGIRQAAIVQEALKVEMLAYEPDHPDVQAAWQLTLNNLGQLFALARAHNIPVALVVFPFTFQFEGFEGFENFEDIEIVENDAIKAVEALSTPQTIVGTYARNQGVPVLNLLPYLAERLQDEGLSPAAYFLDQDHLSPLGSEVVASLIADFLQQEALVEIQ